MNTMISKSKSAKNAMIIAMDVLAQQIVIAKRASPPMFFSEAPHVFQKCVLMGPTLMRIKPNVLIVNSPALLVKVQLKIA